MPVIDIPTDQALQCWPRSGHLAILDLEYTAWEGSAARAWSGPSEWREIIDIGCIIVDAASFAERCAYTCLVKPERNPILSDYFTSLTGITQHDLVVRGRSFGEALSGLARFVGDQIPIIFNGYDGRIIRENCQMRGIDLPWAVARMSDFRPLLARSLDLPSAELTSSGLPRLAGLELSGREHSALHDCRAIAGSCAFWRKAGRL
jgi:inhibitor of KinA sporulation pathway (predicted exonuclease)